MASDPPRSKRTNDGVHRPPHGEHPEGVIQADPIDRATAPPDLPPNPSKNGLLYTQLYTEWATINGGPTRKNRIFHMGSSAFEAAKLTDRHVKKV